MKTIILTLLLLMSGPVLSIDCKNWFTSFFSKDVPTEKSFDHLDQLLAANKEFTNLFDELTKSAPQKEELTDFLSKKSEKELTELVNENNKLVKRIETLFKKKKFLTTVIKEEVSLGESLFLIEKVQLKQYQGSEHWARLLMKLSQKTEVSVVYISPLQVLLERSVAYFNRDQSITYSFDIFEKMMKENTVTETVWHEFKHAEFELKRLQKQNSIFNIRFYSETKRSLPYLEAGYANYISAEELSTFAQGHWWQLKFKYENLNDSNRAIFFSDLKNTQKQLELILEKFNILINTSMNELSAVTKLDMKDSQTTLKLKSFSISYFKPNETDAFEIIDSLFGDLLHLQKIISPLKSLNGEMKFKISQLEKHQNENFQLGFQDLKEHAKKMAQVVRQIDLD